MVMLLLIISISITHAIAANCDTYTATGIAGGATSCPTNSNVSRYTIVQSPIF